MPLVTIPLSGLNFDPELRLNASPHFDLAQRNSRPLEGLDSEKISIDPGPWFKELYGGGAPQVRIRSKKGSQSYTLDKIIDKIVAQVNSRLERATPKRSMPELSRWFFVCLQQKLSKPHHRASFECVFKVQGYRRDIDSTEEDIELVVRELSSQCCTSATQASSSFPQRPSVAVAVTHLDPPFACSPHCRSQQPRLPELHLGSDQPSLVYHCHSLHPLPQELHTERAAYTSIISQDFHTDDMDVYSKDVFVGENAVSAEELNRVEGPWEAFLSSLSESGKRVSSTPFDWDVADRYVSSPLYGVDVDGTAAGDF